MRSEDGPVRISNVEFNALVSVVDANVKGIWDAVNAAHARIDALERALNSKPVAPPYPPEVAACTPPMGVIPDGFRRVDIPPLEGPEPPPGYERIAKRPREPLNRRVYGRRYIHGGGEAGQEQLPQVLWIGNLFGRESGECVIPDLRKSQWGRWVRDCDSWI